MNATVFVLLSMFVIFGAIGTLNYNGYCVRKFEKLSVPQINEKTSVATYYTYMALLESENLKELLGPYPIKYQSISEFQEKNPDCCRLILPTDADYRPEMNIPSKPRYMGRFRAWVAGKARTGNGQRDIFGGVISNCGRISSYVH